MRAAYRTKEYIIICAFWSHTKIPLHSDGVNGADGSPRIRVLINNEVSESDICSIVVERAYPPGFHVKVFFR